MGHRTIVEVLGQKQERISGQHVITMLREEYPNNDVWWNEVGRFGMSVPEPIMGAGQGEAPRRPTEWAWEHLLEAFPSFDPNGPPSLYHEPKFDPDQDGQGQPHA